MAYVVQADVETYLQITFNAKQIALFSALAPRMEAMVDQYCWAASNPITEKFDGGTDIFFLASPPIASISSITIGSSPFDLTNACAYKSYIKLSAPAPVDYQSVAMVYTLRAISVPAPVKQALIEWIARKIQTSPDSNKEAKDVQTGTIRVSYSEDAVGPMPDFVKLVLDSYRLSSI